jgi:molybdopterin converting factor small subunit
MTAAGVPIPAPRRSPSMHVNVRLFALAKDLAGTGTLVLNLPEGCTVGGAKRELLGRCPELGKLLPVLLLAVNGNYATEDTALSEGCELACFPPVSGG